MRPLVVFGILLIAIGIAGVVAILAGAGMVFFGRRGAKA